MTWFGRGMYSGMKLSVWLTGLYCQTMAPVLVRAGCGRPPTRTSRSLWSTMPSPLMSAGSEVRRKADSKPKAPSDMRRKPRSEERRVGKEWNSGWSADDGENEGRRTVPADDTEGATDEDNGHTRL